MRNRENQWPLKLRDLSLFADCTPAELRQIAPLMTMLTVDAGQTLINEGTIGLEFLIIADGVAEVSVGDGASRRVLAELGAGAFMGEMALLNRLPRTATVTALTPLTFYVCNAAEFAGLLHAAPSVHDTITRAASLRAEANAERASAAAA